MFSNGDNVVRNVVMTFHLKNVAKQIYYFFYHMT